MFCGVEDVQGGMVELSQIAANRNSSARTGAAVEGEHDIVHRTLLDSRALKRTVPLRKSRSHCAPPLIPELLSIQAAPGVPATFGAFGQIFVAWAGQSFRTAAKA